jgi:hypothetical protein
MTDTDSKKIIETEWLQQHTLTQEQTKQLILNKFKRAVAMQAVSNKREMTFQRHQ